MDGTEALTTKRVIPVVRTSGVALAVTVHADAAQHRRFAGLFREAWRQIPSEAAGYSAATGGRTHQASAHFAASRAGATGHRLPHA